ncbi:response regulator [Mesorhizobium sp. PUT5]|uniref:response regulator n=1 Tax=Mesorhizobium sp. PUT5 TaxID=3454629 RepID=UPI003FA4C8A6
MPVADFSRVLVVGRSPVNRIVVSKIVERSGLKPIAEAPETAAAMLHSCLPGTVVLDGGPDNAECDALLPDIVAMRRRTGRLVPCVILLSTRNGMPDQAALSGVVDAVVAKPITPERLQPLIDQLIRRLHHRR